MQRGNDLGVAVEGAGDRLGRRQLTNLRKTSVFVIEADEITGVKVGWRLFSLFGLEFFLLEFVSTCNPSEC